MPCSSPAGQLSMAVLALTAGSFAAPPCFDSPARSFHTGDQVVSEAYDPTGMDIADLDGDGDFDVVLAHVGNFISPKISIHMNNGDGTLAPPAYFSLPGETADVVAADFDGDGDADLAFAEAYSYPGARLFFLRNQGGGTFGPPETAVLGRDPQRLAAADLDQDGDLDLACTLQWFAEQVTVLTNDGDGHFTTSMTLEVSVPNGDGPFDIDASDVDGDGWTDIVASMQETTMAVAVLMNDGTGGLLPPQFHGGPFGRPSIALDDPDLDGDLDVIVSTDWIENLGGGVFGPASPLPTLPLYSSFGDVACADVDGDGGLDVLGVQYSSSDAGWLLIPSAGPGAFGSPTQYRSGEYARAIEIADMDGDGDQDAVIGNGHSLTVKIFENDEGGFALPPVTGTGSGLTLGMDAADLDLDGDLDVVAGAYDVYRHMNNGDGTFTSVEIPTILGRKYRFRLGDVDGDLYPDLLFIRHPDTPPYNLYVALSQGDGSFGPTVTWFLTDSCGTSDIDTVDWDNDGDLDVVIADHLGCPSTEGVRLHLVENNGDGTFQPDTPAIDFTAADPFRLVTGDFDQDGFADVLATVSEDVAFWKGDGNGTFAPPVLSALDPTTHERNPWHMTAADFDGDGILDVATANVGWTIRGENVTVLRGLGDGTFAATGLYYSMHSLQFVGTGGLAHLDADGDGDIDLVAGAIYGADIILLRNHGDGTFEIGDRYGVNGLPFDLRTGDFDGDGTDDVAAHLSFHFDGGVTVLPGIAGGSRAPGDVTGDGVVDASDLIQVIVAWGPCPAPPTTCSEDLDGDGVVDTDDLVLVVLNWS